MRIPPRLQPLVEEGIIERIVRPLLSGKEAQVYLVESGGELRVAKVYKEASQRSFRNRSGYTEGRSVRSSRDRRAMARRSRHGRAADEEAWKTAEVQVLRTLYNAGLRVPTPHAFVEGVLVMECVQGEDGGPAPRLAECTLDGPLADKVCAQLIEGAKRMLCEDIVHGDLSPYNVLIDADGAVLIDFPQSVNAARNSAAREMLLRDVANITARFLRHLPREERRHGHEMWALYEAGELHPDTPLTGRFELPSHEVDAEHLLLEMLEIEEDEAFARGADRDV